METRSKWTDLIPDTGLKIAEVYDQGDGLYTPGISSLLKVTTGEGAQKNFTGKTGFGEIKQFEDGDDVPAVSRDKTYTTKVAYSNYGGAVEVTKNQIEDRDFSEELDEMKDISKSTNFSVDKSGIQLFNGAFATTTSVNGYTMTWYGDGVAQMSTVHPTVVAGGSTQSNASSTGIKLTVDNYETGMLNIELQQTDNGKPLTMSGSISLVVPKQLQRKGQEILETDKTPESANNAINVFNGTATLVSSKLLSSVNGGSNTAWFLVSSTDSKLYHETRQEKRLESSVNIRNKVATFTVDARWANYSKDWRGTYGSKGDLATYSG